MVFITQNFVFFFVFLGKTIINLVQKIIKKREEVRY